MSIYLNQLPALDPATKLVNVVIDTPKGSRNKYNYDEKAGIWRLSMLLPLGAKFPYDFGFVPAKYNVITAISEQLVVAGGLNRDNFENLIRRSIQSRTQILIEAGIAIDGR